MGASGKRNYKARRLVAALLVAIVSVSGMIVELIKQQPINTNNPTVKTQKSTKSEATQALESIEVKGRAPKTGYKRINFGNGWMRGLNGCDTRNVILKRDLTDVRINEKCKVLSGVLADPYTGKTVQFIRGEATSDDVQIDHVVSLSNAWQTGAQLLPPEKRLELANDPLNLLAVDGSANQQKGDGDAATWLPSNRSYRCAYVTRQINVKKKYKLWITPPEKSAMQRVLSQCM